MERKWLSKNTNKSKYWSRFHSLARCRIPGVVVVGVNKAQHRATLHQSNFRNCYQLRESECVWQHTAWILSGFLLVPVLARAKGKSIQSMNYQIQRLGDSPKQVFSWEDEDTHMSKLGLLSSYPSLFPSSKHYTISIIADLRKMTTYNTSLRLWQPLVLISHTRRDFPQWTHEAGLSHIWTGAVSLLKHWRPMNCQ